MATPTIPNGEEHFFPIVYEGNGGGQKVGKFVPFTNNGTIANSCIFNDGDSAYLTRTPSSSGSATTFTISAWVKFSALGTSQELFGNSPSGSAASILTVLHYTDNTIYVQGFTNGGSYTMNLQTRRQYNDTSKWYHILIAFDTTQSTSTDRVKIYIDGTLQSLAQTTYPGQNENFGTNQSGIPQTVGRYNYDATRYFDGYMAEVNMVDGTALTPSTFGVTDTSTGRWIPKTLTGITYGTNGYRLKFQDSSALGDDTSGNGNDFTATNLASTDQTTDSPTQNFVTFGNGERFFGTQQATEQGGLTIYAASGSGYPGVSAGKEIPQSGKWYWEVKLDAVGAVNGITNPTYGVIDRNIKEINNFSTSSQIDQQVGGMGGTFWSGFKFGGLLSTGTDFTIGSYVAADNDYVLFAFDMDEGKAWWGFNDSSAGSSVVWFANDGGTDGNPSTGANPTVTFNPRDHRFVPIQQFYAPGSGYSARYNFNFGSKAFAFTAPTGFSGLSQNNFPETDKGVSGLTWTKDRDATASWMCIDSSRIYSAENVPGAMNLNNTNREYGQVDFVDGINKFLKGGYALVTSNNTYSYMNKSGNSNVSYSWVANSGTTSSNTTGSITSTVQANTTAGFSIVQYVGTGSSGSVGHGLSAAPEWMIIKERDTDSTNWRVYHKSIGGITKYLVLNTTAAPATASMWGAPTASAFIIGGTGYEVNESGKNYVAYCWHGVDGFSKFGKYVGNGTDTDGPFIYTGFTPAFVIFKANRVTNWYSHDGARNPANPVTIGIDINTTAAEYNGGVYVGNGLDFVSNGFKIKQATGLGYNYTGEEIYYMAFAKQSFLGDGTNPATAR